MLAVPPRANRAGREPRRRCYGVVVDSVNVSVLLYAPVRSASVAPIDCLNLTVTASLEVGADQVFSGVGAAEPPTGANAVPVPGLQRLRQRERAVDQVAGRGRARVGDGQRRVTRAARSRSPCVDAV